MSSTTIFTKIIERVCPAHIVAEDENFIAFLDLHPVALGHTLVVPKQAIDYFFDLEDKVLSGLICFAKRVAKGIEQVVPALRIGIKVFGLDVAHAHLHLIPIFSKKDFSMSGQAPSLSDAEVVTLRQKIRTAINGYQNYLQSIALGKR